MGDSESESDAEMNWLSDADAEVESAAVVEASATPDWLSGATSDDSESGADWLTSMGDSESESDAEMDWLSDAATDVESESALETSTTPDWLGGATSDDSESGTDWLTSTGETESESDADAEMGWLTAPSDEAQPEPPTQAVPNWLSDENETETATGEDESEEAAEADWLNELEEDESELDWMSSTSEEATPSADVPDWLQQPESKEANASVESDLDWLTEEPESASEDTWAEAKSVQVAAAVFEEDTIATGDIPDWLTEAEDESPSAKVVAEEGFSSAPAKLPSWMSAFTDEEESVEEHTTELNAFLADFVDPGAAQIGALRPVVAQVPALPDNNENLLVEDDDEDTPLDFSFNFEFEQPPAWMRGKSSTSSQSFFRPRWMRGGKK